MLKNNKEMENQLLKALESLAEQSKPNIARTAREFAVPVNRLRHGKEENRFRNDTLMAVSLALYKNKLCGIILIALTRSEPE